MRIYLPATAAELATAAPLPARTAHAVTAALRAAAPGETEEDLEVPAFLDAADASLRRLGGDDVPVRVVVAAEVGDAAPTGGPVLTEVRAPAVPWRDVVSIHVDDPDDATAHDVVRAALAGDHAALAAAAELDLLWYDATERAELCRVLGVVPDRDPA